MSGYGQYCPIAKAAEVLGEKWSILILRELCLADQSFNSLRKGMPLVSPTLLSKRLKTLAFHNIIKRIETSDGVFYQMDEAGLELKEMIMQLGIWGQRWVKSDYGKGDIDASLLVWDLHRSINLTYFSDEQKVIQFEFFDAPAKHRFFWLVIKNQSADMCIKNPGYEVDLYIKTFAKDFTEMWMGEVPYKSLSKNNKIKLEGDRVLKNSFTKWLGSSCFAGIENMRVG